MENEVTERVGVRIGDPHGRQEVGGQQPGEHLGVDLVGLHLGLRNHPRLERVRDDDPAGVLAQEPLEGDRVGAGLESHLIVRAEPLSKGSDLGGAGGEATALDRADSRPQDGHLRAG